MNVVYTPIISHSTTAPQVQAADSWNFWSDCVSKSSLYIPDNYLGLLNQSRVVGFSFKPDGPVVFEYGRVASLHENTLKWCFVCFVAWRVGRPGTGRVLNEVFPTVLAIFSYSRLRRNFYGVEWRSASNNRRFGLGGMQRWTGNENVLRLLLCSSACEASRPTFTQRNSDSNPQDSDYPDAKIQLDLLLPTHKILSEIKNAFLNSAEDYRTLNFTFIGLYRPTLKLRVLKATVKTPTKNSKIDIFTA